MPTPSEEESQWPRRLEVVDGCLVVHADDYDLLEALLLDSECRQQLQLKLLSFDASMRMTE